MANRLVVLQALARRFAFRDLKGLLREGTVDDLLPASTITQARQLCAFGQRLLDLDAEDFAPTDEIEQDGLVPAELLHRAALSRMPQRANEMPRGAMDSLIPAYQLILAVIDAHWHRRSMAALVSVAHIAAEYAPLLAWQPVLGHAGDPTRLAGAVGGEGSRWGTDDRDCPHSSADRSAAGRALRVPLEPASGWRAYLDRQHSSTAHAFGVCTQCKRPCRVMTQLAEPDRTALTRRGKVAVEFDDCALIRLRHAAPVGHGFGVPSPAEVLDAWAASRARLARFAPTVAEDDGFVLPGLPALFGVIGAASVRPDTLLIDVVDSLIVILRS